MSKLKNALVKLNYPIKTCKLCFKDFSIKNLCLLFDGKIYICPNCLKQLKPRFYKFKIDNINGLSIYDYDENIKSLIYQYKGCYDIELKYVFLSPYKKLIKLLYIDYYLVFVPSSDDDNKKRGFNHVYEMFSMLNMKSINAIIKIDNYKQSEQDQKGRENIYKHLKLIHSNFIRDKKILLVDDILTTGNTLKSCIELLKASGAKKIKILTVAKVKSKDIVKNNKYIEKNGLLHQFYIKMLNFVKKINSKKIIKKDKE